MDAATRVRAAGSISLTWRCLLLAPHSDGMDSPPLLFFADWGHRWCDAPCRYPHSRKSFERMDRAAGAAPVPPRACDVDADRPRRVRRLRAHDHRRGVV